VGHHAQIRWSLINYFPGLVSNCSSPELHLPSSWDYRCESLCPAMLLFLVALKSRAWDKDSSINHLFGRWLQETLGSKEMVQRRSRVHHLGVEVTYRVMSANWVLAPGLLTIGTWINFKSMRSICFISIKIEIIFPPLGNLMR
jgi:hypothetical protein